MQVRMHWGMSIFSAAQASAQLVQIAAQNMAWRTASASGSLRWPPTSGWAAIILAIDMAALLGGLAINRFSHAPVPVPLERRAPLL
jgi:hypothetical protein